MSQWRGNWVVLKPGHIRHLMADTMTVEAADHEAAVNAISHAVAKQQLGDEREHGRIQVNGVTPAT